MGTWLLTTQEGSGIVPHKEIGVEFLQEEKTSLGWSIIPGFPRTEAFLGTCNAKTIFWQIRIIVTLGERNGKRVKCVKDSYKTTAEDLNAFELGHC